MCCCMSKLKIEYVKLNKDAVGKLLKSDEFMSELQKQARERGEIVKSFVGVNRVHVYYKGNRKGENT